jgi:predicted acyltransferase
MEAPLTTLELERTAARRAEAPAAATGRLLSLDVLRGLTVIGMIVVNTAAGLDGGMRTFPILLHAHWAGFTLADAVFPAFLFMVGVSIPMALAPARADGLSPAILRRIIQRSLVLVLIGVLLHNLGTFSDFSRPLRAFGVLQRIGVVYGACAVLFLTLSGRTRLLLIAALLLGYWALLYVPTPDGLPTDLWTRGRNFVSAFDRLLLGVHRYVKGPDGYDPEGLLGDIPSVAHGLIGVAVGEYVRGRPQPAATLRLAAAGLAMAAAGAAWGLVLPVVKSLWTPSFVLLSCGLTTLVLAGLRVVLDGREGAARNPLVVFTLAFGANAIAAYVLHELAACILGADLFTVPYRNLAPALGREAAELVPIATFLAIVWLPLEYMRRQRWIVKV